MPEAVGIPREASVAVFGACIVLVPAVQLLGVLLTLPVAHRRGPGWPAALLRQLVLFPLSGGGRCLVFQALTWNLWLLSALVMLRVRDADSLPGLQPDLMAVAAAGGALASALFATKSLLVFEPSSRGVHHPWRSFLSGKAAIEWDVGKLPSRLAASYIVVAMGVLWAALGGALLLAADALADPRGRVLYLSMAAAAVSAGAFTTYGLAGYLRFGGASSADRSGGGGAARGSRGRGGASGGGAIWQFWQPFRGGPAFVASQALGWMAYSAALCCIAFLLGQALAGVAVCLRYWAAAAGAVMFAAELVLAGSLLLFQGRMQAAKERRAAAWLWATLQRGAVISILYVPMHVFCATVAVTYVALPARAATALWAGGLFVYYSLTSFGASGQSGRREWRAFADWFGGELQRVLPLWAGQLEVVMDGPPPDPGKRHILAYAPHGLYPVGAGYLPLLPAFRAAAPGLRPATLIAGICLQLPLMRDILSWLGMRVVSAPSFRAALRERGSVLLVPGGQAELVHAHRLPSARQFVVYTGHKGFVRLAVSEGARLVPVLALGELGSLRNIIHAPRLQKWTYKRLGFPVPFLIGGKWGVLPFPSRTGLRFVVGQPIDPGPPAAPGTPGVEGRVDALHAAFYNEVAALFRKHAPSFPGYEDVELVMSAE